MTRFAIDAHTAVRLVRDERTLNGAHALVGPAILRSHAMAALYREVRAGRLDEAEGRRVLEGIAALKIRLLGDRVSRSSAWKIAAGLDWDDPAPAEYLAVAVLQADALITDDPVLIAGAGELVRAQYDDLFR
ncbi:hypothetical protein [Microbacterium invictum]|uniref:Nucleic acid-binding protein n=1 Tax=Microbacterium invictum TaxID=515415 RepID=A0AA40SLG1_9MICO|nr:MULTISPECIES: hypothetical protein [Microbacterium]MBB4138403.1 putative nucleic acid-binding protein [Microbacterium invictum]